MIRRRTLTAPLAAAAVVLALAACSSTQRPGAAAMVGGAPITEETVATLAGEVRAVTGASLGDDDAASVNRQVISGLIQSEIIDTAATREGVQVTAAQVDSLINSAAQQGGGLAELQKSLASQYGIAPSQIEDFARSNLQFQGLATKLGGGDAQAGSEKASAALGALSVELGTTVNPRFGRWEPLRLSVGLPADDLSTPPADGGRPAASLPIVPGS